MTTVGAIDSATAYMVPALLTFKSPHESFLWARQSALGFTVASLFLDNTVLAANPVVAASASGAGRFQVGGQFGVCGAGLGQRDGGLWGTFLSSLGGSLKVEATIEGKVRKQALKATHKLACDHCVLQATLASLRRHASFESWLLWNTQYEWAEHTRRLGGFFDREFVREVSSVAEVSLSEVDDIWRRMSAPEAVQQLGQRVRTGTVDDVDSLAVEGWLTATIMRGFYHDELAKRLDRQHFRHPIRAISRGGGSHSPSRQLFPTNDAQRYFAAIILGLSLSAADSTARVRLYGQNLTRCRTVISAGRLQLGEPEAPMTDDVGLDRAVREAQSLVREGVLEVDSKRFTWCVDASIGIAVAMSGFSLSPWVGLVVGAGSAAAQAIIEPGRRAATVRDSSQRRLQDLARAVAGSVDVTVW